MKKGGTNDISNIAPSDMICCRRNFENARAAIVVAGNAESGVPVLCSRLEKEEILLFSGGVVLLRESRFSYFSHVLSSGSIVSRSQLGTAGSVKAQNHQQIKHTKPSPLSPNPVLQ